MSTGDIIHARLIYLVDAEGQIVAATSGSVRELAAIVPPRFLPLRAPDR
jgi:hypothetical protein